MIKHPNWRTKLARYLLDNQHRPFEWGAFDCCLFAADALKIQTGQDYAEAFRGRYKTELGAARALKRYGSGTLEDTLDQILGAGQNGVLRDGDITLNNTENGPAVGVFYSGVIWVPGETKLQHIRTQPIKFWRF